MAYEAFRQGLFQVAYAVHIFSSHMSTVVHGMCISQGLWHGPTLYRDPNNTEITMHDNGLMMKMNSFEGSRNVASPLELQLFFDSNQIIHTNILHRVTAIHGTASVPQ